MENSPLWGFINAVLIVLKKEQAHSGVLDVKIMSTPFHSYTIPAEDVSGD